MRELSFNRSEKAPHSLRLLILCFLYLAACTPNHPAEEKDHPAGKHSSSTKLSPQDLTITLIAIEDEMTSYLGGLTEDCRKKYQRLIKTVVRTQSLKFQWELYECGTYPTFHLDVKNGSSAPIYDVDLKIEALDSDGVLYHEAVAFEAKWEPGERLKLDRPDGQLEKFTVTVTSRGIALRRRFEFYEFPSIDSGAEVRPEFSEVLSASGADGGD